MEGADHADQVTADGGRGEDGAWHDTDRRRLAETLVYPVAATRESAADQLTWLGGGRSVASGLEGAGFGVASESGWSKGGVGSADAPSDDSDLEVDGQQTKHGGRLFPGESAAQTSMNAGICDYAVPVYDLLATTSPHHVCNPAMVPDNQ